MPAWDHRVLSRSRGLGTHGDECAHARDREAVRATARRPDRRRRPCHATQPRPRSPPPSCSCRWSARAGRRARGPPAPAPIVEPGPSSDPTPSPIPRPRPTRPGRPAPTRPPAIPAAGPRRRAPPLRSCPRSSPPPRAPARRPRTAAADPTDRWIVVLKTGTDAAAHRRAPGQARSGFTVDRTFSHAFRGFSGDARPRPGRRPLQPRPVGRDDRRRREDRGRGPDRCRPGSAGSAPRIRRSPRSTASTSGSTPTSRSSTPGSRRVADLNVVGGYNCSTTNRARLARRLRPRHARRRHGRRASTTAAASSASRPASASGP